MQYQSPSQIHPLHVIENITIPKSIMIGHFFYLCSSVNNKNREYFVFSIKGHRVLSIQYSQAFLVIPSKNTFKIYVNIIQG